MWFWRWAEGRACGRSPNGKKPPWLVMHNDDRHRSDVRIGIDRMAALVMA